jgi:hypothetical protein
MNTLLTMVFALLLCACGARYPNAGHKAHAQVLAGSAPATENAYFQYIATAPRSQRIFTSAEGGLLRSDDGGRSFKYVIAPARSLAISGYLVPAKRPNVVVASGYDRNKGAPYLGWSWNAGETWIDLSSLLPGYKNDGSRVTVVSEDQQGRILLSVKDAARERAQLVAVTLGLLY